MAGPLPSTDRRLLSLPFSKGLSQREDPRWLGPGALITGQNAVHPKTSIVAKRPGCQTFPLAGVASVPPQTRSLTAGKRLAALDGQLVAVGPDAFGDALWAFSETPNGAESVVTPVFKDRVPEVYSFPPRVLVGGSGVVLDMDSCTCNGWLVHVWLYGVSTEAGAPAVGCDVYYQVESAATGNVLVGPQSVGQVPAGNGAVAPKIVACGTTAILTFVSGSNDYSLYATALNLVSPTNAWVAAQRVVALPSPPLTYTSGTTGTGPYLGVYDLDSVIGDATQYVLCAAQGTTGAGSSASHITLYRCSAANTLSGGTIVTASANIEGADALWGSDGNPHNTLTAIAIRADSTNGEVLCTYGWNTNALGAGGSTRVSQQLRSFPALASVATAVNLMATPGIPNPTNADSAPQWIAVDRVTKGGTTLYKTYFSPSSCFWDAGQGGGSGQTSAYTADYLTAVVAGAMVVQGNQPRITYGVRLASRVIQRNGIGYVMGYLPSRTQGTYFLFADDAWSDTASTGVLPMRLVGTFAPRLASGPALFFFAGTQVSNQPNLSSFTLPHMVSNPSAPGGDVVYTLLSVTQGQITVTEPNLFAWDFKSALGYQPAQLGENLGLACACPSAFDGQNVFEFGFPYYPFVVSATGTAPAGGGLVAGQTYNYIITFEKRDARGQKHRSGRSVPFSFTVPSAKTAAQLVITPMGFSAREKGVQVPGNGPQGYAATALPITIKVARTVAGGTTYFYVDATDYVSGNGGDNTVGFGTTAAKLNTPGEPTTLITDGVTDALLTTHEELYDDGGDGTQPGSILDNLCAPGFQALIVHQSRFFGIDGNNVWPSKAFADGEGSGFNEEFNFTLDDGPGVLTALASLDDKLILFKRDRLYYMTGFGPNDSGGASDWSPPQRIASDCGCIDWRGVVVTPQGCWFMSDAGLRLLTRDLQVQQVTNIEDTLNAYYLMSSGIVHPTRNRVLWTANTDDTSNPRTGVGLDHDYVLDSWMTSLSTDGSSTQGAVSAVVANALVTGTNEPTYHWLRAGGVVCRETPGQALDGSVYAPMTIETAWIKGDGLEAFARFRRLMVTWENNDPHQLLVYVAYDYSPTATAPTYYLIGTVTAAMMTRMATPLCQEQFPLPRQRAEAVRLRLSTRRTW